MITRRRILDLPDTYPLERIGDLSELLFFDIETTGFSADYNRLYLIGCSYYRDGSWNLIQWFADTAGAEEELLHQFFAFIKDYRILIHFNGDGFDIPYLLKRCDRLGLPYGFSGIQSFDIYKKCKPYRKLLSLDSLKQKSIERFLGIHRQDQYNGGQLIEVYQDYLQSHDDFLYDMLILHNAEDLEGMPLILPILNYPDFFEQELSVTSMELGTDCLTLTLSGDVSLPVPFQTGREPVALTASGNVLTLRIGLYEGTLKHFYPNYKDYYYLIYEDTAVHKSIGEYVDKGARIRATAKTCYTKKSGRFLPQFTTLWEPELKKEPKDKISYADCSAVRLQDEESSQIYIRQLFDWLGVRIVRN